jgi:hypothetical protein
MNSPSGTVFRGIAPERSTTTSPSDNKEKPRDRAKYVSRPVHSRGVVSFHVSQQWKIFVDALLITSPSLRRSEPTKDGQMTRGTACVPSQARLAKLKADTVYGNNS